MDLLHLYALLRRIETGGEKKSKEVEEKKGRKKKRKEKKGKEARLSAWEAWSPSERIKKFIATRV